MCKVSELLVLVVDSDDNISNICSRISTETGLHRILCASSIAEANLLWEKDIDLIIARKSLDPSCELAQRYGNIVIYYGPHNNDDIISSFTGGASMFIDTAESFTSALRTIDVARLRCVHG